MEKKKLKEIPVKALEESFIKELELVNSEGKEKSLLNAYTVKGILIMDIYLSNGYLYYRIFQSKDDYIGLERKYNDEWIWRAGSIESMNMYDYRGGSMTPIFLINDMSSIKVINKYLGAYGNPIDLVKSKQEEIRAKRLAIEHKKITDEIDKEMKSIKALPKDFNKWLNDVALIKSRYIIYDYKSSGSMKGYCTHCHNQIEVVQPKNNTEGKCPRCKSNIIYKASGRMGTIRDKMTVQLLQKHQRGLVIREFVVYKNYPSEDKGRKSDLSYIELNRTIKGNDLQYHRNYAWDKFKSTDIVRWCEDKSWNIDIGRIYERNLSRTIKNTAYQYSALREHAKKNNRCSLHYYLESYAKGPALEYIVKLGFNNLAREITDPYSSRMYKQSNYNYINLNGKTLIEVFGLSKSEIKRAMELDVNFHSLSVMMESKKYNVKLTNEEINNLAKEHIHDIEDYLEAASYSNTYQLNKYLETKDVDFGDYRDYIGMAKDLGWDLNNRFVLFPYHFIESHDQAMQLTEVKESLIETKAIMKQYHSLSQVIGYKDEHYIIKMPRGAKEVIREGHRLNHCVATYTKRIADGKTIICFIRKIEDPYNPYYTLELDPKTFKVKQVRGYKNASPPEEVNKTIEAYKTYLKKNNKGIVA